MGCSIIASPSVAPPTCTRSYPRYSQNRLTDSILRLPDSAAQNSLVLLRFCAGPRLNYWLRSLPFQVGGLDCPGSRQSDVDRLLHGFGAVPSSDAASRIRLQLALPPSLGGVGLCGRQGIVPVAPLSSWASTFQLLVPSTPHLELLPQQRRNAALECLQSLQAQLASLRIPSFSGVIHPVPLLSELQMVLATCRSAMKLPVDPRAPLSASDSRLNRAAQFASWSILLDFAIRPPRPTPTDELDVLVHPAARVAGQIRTPLMFLQHLFSQEIHKQLLDQLFRASPLLTDRARLLSIQGELGSLWLSAGPSQSRFRLSGVR